VVGIEAGTNDCITRPLHIGEVTPRNRALIRIQDLQKNVMDREKKRAYLENKKRGDDPTSSPLLIPSRLAT
jgi:DNA-binding response OmpR family regulator